MFSNGASQDSTNTESRASGTGIFQVLMPAKVCRSVRSRREEEGQQLGILCSSPLSSTKSKMAGKAMHHAAPRPMSCIEECVSDFNNTSPILVHL